MKIIGFCGKAGAGKDYVAEAIRQDLDKRDRWGVRVAFADGLKLDIEEALSGNLMGQGFGAPHIDVLWDKPYSDEVRWLLQQWGTELRREQDEDYWARKGMQRADDIYKMEGADVILFTDVRFDNEARAITEAGGLICMVTADAAIRAERLGGKLPPAHASEVIDFDYHAIIPNNGSTEYPIELVEYLDNI